MIRTLTGVAIVFGLAGGASAETCSPERIAGVVGAYRFVATSSTPQQEFIEKRREIDAAAAACPDTAWIRITAAGAEMMALERLEAASRAARTNAEKDDGYAHVQRAAAHVLAFRDHYPEDFRYASIQLAYRDWSGIVEPVVHAMLRYASDGYVHPLVSDEPPPLACDYVTKAMATSASGYRFVSNQASLTFLTTMADVCRSSPDPLDWNVLIQRSNRLVRLVETEGISKPDHIRWALREAYRDSRKFLQGHEPPRGLWFESNKRSLQAMLEKHSVDLGFLSTYSEVPRADWFKPEHVGTEDLTYSIALAINRLWTPLEAGITDAASEDVTKARGAVMMAIREMGTEADAAGQTVAGRTRIIEAMAAFQRADVRTAAMAASPGMPNWMFDIIRNTFQRAIDEAG